MLGREFIALVGGGGLLLTVKVKRAWGQQPAHRHPRRYGNVAGLPGYLYFGCQPAASSGMRSKKCQTPQKSSPGEHGASETRTIKDQCGIILERAT